MNERELHARFRELGFELPHPSIKRWSRQGLLPQPGVAASRGVGRGRGRAADWPESTVKQAAAIYTMRNQGYPGQKKRISPKTVAAISGFANTFFVWLEEYRSNVNDPQLSAFYNRFYTPIDVKVPSEFIKENDRKNDKGEVWSWRPALFDEARESLAVKWIATVEKIELNIPVTSPLAIKYDFSRARPRGDDALENATIPMLYRFGSAEVSEADAIYVIALTFPEYENLALSFEKNTALVGFKDRDGWTQVVP